jgi:uncharacterized protein
MPKFLITTVFLFFSFQLAQAQGYPSLLWEIKKDNQPLGYLFGTMHSGDSAVFAQLEGLMPYLKQCVVFSGELDFDESMSQELLGQISLFMTDTTLKDLYSPEDYAFVTKELSEKWPAESMMSETIMPFWTSTFLTVDFETESMNQALDIVLQERAVELGMAILPLETAIEQMRSIESIPLRIQADMLLDLIKNFELQQDLMLTLPELYGKQDLQALHDLYSEDEFPMVMHEALITNRNILMADRLETLITETPKVFCAVGALHLPGKDGLIMLLRARGYSVDPVVISD